MATAATKTTEKISHAVNEKKVEADQPDQPGREHLMDVQAEWIKETYKGSEKLKGKVALITGGDSGIGRAVAIHFAREGASGIAIVHKPEEQKDADDAIKMVEAEGAKCISIAADVGDPQACERIVDQTVKQFGKLDILINNAAEQHKRESLQDITPEELQRTFATNIFSMFYMTKAVEPHLKKGAAVINSTSVQAYKGNPVMLGYSTTKGAIVTFTRSLSQLFIEKGIRVNAVAPGPIWTPLIPSTFGEESAETFGKQVPMQRPGQPSEVAPCYVFLASETDSSFVNGQVLHPNGGTVLNV